MKKNLFVLFLIMCILLSMAGCASPTLGVEPDEVNEPTIYGDPAKMDLEPLVVVYKDTTIDEETHVVTKDDDKAYNGVTGEKLSKEDLELFNNPKTVENPYFTQSQYGYAPSCVMSYKMQEDKGASSIHDIKLKAYIPAVLVPADGNGHSFKQGDKIKCTFQTGEVTKGEFVVGYIEDGVIFTDKDNTLGDDEDGFEYNFTATKNGTYYFVVLLSGTNDLETTLVVNEIKIEMAQP